MHRYNPQRADISAHYRVAGLRGLCHHPFVLVDDPSPRGLLALAERVAVSRACATLDGHVDRGGCGHHTLAGIVAIPGRMELAAGNGSFRRRSVGLQTRWFRL